MIAKKLGLASLYIELSHSNELLEECSKTLQCIKKSKSLNTEEPILMSKE